MKCLSLLLGFLVASSALAQDLPPLGERSYQVSLPQEAETGPVVVMPSRTNLPGTGQALERVVYMRDPTYDVATEVAPVKRAKAAKPKKLKVQSKSLKFKTFAIKGRLTKPRVRFERPSLPIKRSRETFSIPFDPQMLESTSNQLDSVGYPE